MNDTILRERYALRIDACLCFNLSGDLHHAGSLVPLLDNRFVVTRMPYLEPGI